MEVEFMAEFTDHMSRDRARKIVKRKRTKRQRPSSSFCDSLIDNSTPELSSEEDEDMANCLIMLAQSGSLVKEAESESESDPSHQKTKKLSSRRFTELITTTREGENEKSGSYVYECKTCNRTFPSFQALGGHRASHKKPKFNVKDKKSYSVSVHFSDEENEQHKVIDVENKENTQQMVVNNNNIVKCASPLLPAFNQTVLTNNKTKVHECSICGSEFSSGQALGGHMRRHRPIGPSVNRLTESVTEKLSLDLNFPPPEVADDDVVRSTFKFTAGSSQQHMVFSGPALVDCHY